MHRSSRRALALALALGAASASATPSGNKWMAVPSYRVFDHSTTSGISGVTNFGATGGVLESVRGAFGAWTSTFVTCTSWTSTYAGLIGGSPTTALINGNDNNNYVVWLGPGQWRYGTATLGLTTTTYLTSNRQIVDADLEMNDTPLGSGPRWSASGDPTRYDYPSVVLHEAGHFLGLDHTDNDPTAVMYPTISPGEVKRTLATADLADVCGIYPSGAGAQGAPCTVDGNCGGGRVCRSPSGSTAKICTVACTIDANCPAGTTCQNANTARACFLPTAPPELCKFCTAGADCPSGRCVNDGAGHQFCTITCGSAQDCGTGYDCIATQLGQLCVPQSTCTGQCSFDTDCAPGYTCSGTVCEPTGNPGDRCDISLYCKPCSVCIGTLESAYCLACCGGGGGTDECMGCTPVSCGASATCIPVTGTTDQVCVPSTGAGLCEACSLSVPCSSGMTCAAGRCHNDCNPFSPGACTACLDVGNGEGICACGDEVSQVGQPCGLQSDGGLRICTNTTLCLNAPSSCYRPCIPGGTPACPTGQVCGQVDGENVCVTSGAGGGGGSGGGAGGGSGGGTGGGSAGGSGGGAGRGPRSSST